MDASRKENVTDLHVVGFGGKHHYTASEVERDHLVSIGWLYEDFGWYGVK
ncbi:MAG TPA: hypothetical protein OIM11_02065 [Coriobacteriaceae bacterium]|nr:hypothetical protein [Coriobacteriaceae bacterium]